MAVVDNNSRGGDGKRGCRGRGLLGGGGGCGGDWWGLSEDACSERCRERNKGWLREKRRLIIKRRLSRKEAGAGKNRQEG